jgi:tRNA-Thr(GGU) m(6)t(6)A37 methyltransferase TsaA
MKTNIQINPIGTAHNEGSRFYLSIDEPYRDALINLNGFSHVHVLYWAHENDSQEYRSAMVANKPYKIGPDQIGVFATRSEYRPNPILMTVLPVISVDEESGVIELAFNDALDNSPILDIKPYLPSVDRVTEVKQASWAEPWPSCYEDSATYDWASVFNF